MGPLGNSFNTKENANYVLVAGGLGVPPLVRAAQAIADLLTAIVAVILFVVMLPELRSRKAR